MVWIWNGFRYLHTRRGEGFSGPLSIPPSEIAAYCDLFGIRDPDRREDFARFIALLDDEFGEHVARQQEDKPPQKPGAKTSPTRSRS